jgi:ribose transport system substrate-binding protein
MRRRLFISCFVGLASFVLFASCTQQTPVPAPAPVATGTPVQPGKLPTDPKERLVGISLLTLENDFFRIIGDNLTAELAKEGYKTVVVAGENDVAKQHSQVEDFIAKSCTAIVLCPCDSKGIGPAIQKANTAGIPVFTVDIGCLAPNAKVRSHVATDNYGGGKQAAEAMIEALGGQGGKIAILDMKATESCLLRVKGFKEVIAAHNEKNPDRKVDIVAELPGDGKREKGLMAAADALQSHEDLVGIFAINDPSALGAVTAVENAKKTSQVKIIGFDGQRDGKEAIRDGKIYADPIQYPDRMGRLTAQSIIKHYEGEEVLAEQLIPTELYRQADGQNDPALKKKSAD